ncbi:MAG: 50S ribosomal protein L24 [Candidatus Hodarchaeales archaeon]
MHKTKSPRKNRVRTNNRPLHSRMKKLNVSLSSELRKKYGNIRNLPVKKGDTVSLVRGKDVIVSQKKQVTKVDLTKMKIQIDGAKLTKTDGTEILRWVSPANVKLVQLGKVDRKRQKIIDRRMEARKKIDEAKAE